MDGESSERADTTQSWCLDESEPHTSGYTTKMRMYGSESNTPLPFALHYRKRRIEQSIIPSSGASLTRIRWDLIPRMSVSPFIFIWASTDPTRWKFPKLYCTARIPTPQFLIQINQFKGPSGIQDSRSRILLRGSNMPFQWWIKSDGNLQSQPPLPASINSQSQSRIDITNRQINSIHTSRSSLVPCLFLGNIL